MNQEEIIWQTILESAKKKFDYALLEQQFSEVHEAIADDILSKVIEDFAGGRTTEVIVAELFNQVLMIGFIWKREEIHDFVAGKDHILRLEIYATQLASSLLREGHEPAQVLVSISQLLN